VRKILSATTRKPLRSLPMIGKRIGGSQSDDWNHVLGNQALQSLWIKQSDNEVRERQYNAAIAGLIGIAPQDEIEGMIAVLPSFAIGPCGNAPFPIIEAFAVVLCAHSGLMPAALMIGHHFSTSAF
jgi:hypothetical protein